MSVVPQLSQKRARLRTRLPHDGQRGCSRFATKALNPETVIKTTGSTMAFESKRALAEIDEAMSVFTDARKRSQHEDLSDLPSDEQEEIATRLGSTLSRWAPVGSVFWKKYEKYHEKAWEDPHALNVALPGILRALREDYAKGRLKSVEELIRGELLTDMLELAAELVSKSPDAAAVLAGGVLEEHLRRLCLKLEIPLEAENGKHKSTETMASELVKKDALSKTDHKSVTYWYGIRNDPAHGRFGKHEANAVGLMVHGVRDFIRRIGA